MINCFSGFDVPPVLNRAGLAGGSNSSHEGLGVKGLPRAVIVSRTASKV